MRKVIIRVGDIVALSCIVNFAMQLAFVFSADVDIRSYLNGICLGAILMGYSITDSADGFDPSDDCSTQSAPANFYGDVVQWKEQLWGQVL